MTQNGKGEPKAMTTVMEITPQLAQEWLDHRNNSNRPLSVSTVRKYAKEIKEGRWRFNGVPILFDTEGNLLDGQHRLHAVVATGVTISVLVVRGLDYSVFPTIDTGKARGAADTLAIAGESMVATLGAALRRVVWFERGVAYTGVSTYGSDVSNEDILDAARRHPGIRDSVAIADRARRVAPPGPLACLHYLFAARDPVRADLFVEGLATGVGLDEGDPRLLLRERLMANRGAKARLQEREIAALTIKAWNAFRAGRSIKTLRWRTGGDNPEEFPEVR